MLRALGAEHNTIQYSESCESFLDVGEILCLLVSSRGRQKFGDARHGSSQNSNLFHSSKLVGCFNIPAEFYISSGLGYGHAAHPRD